MGRQQGKSAQRVLGLRRLVKPTMSGEGDRGRKKAPAKGTQIATRQQETTLKGGGFKAGEIFAAIGIAVQKRSAEESRIRKLGEPHDI